MMIALSITSLLLTATMIAINASFIAYASAAEQASTQAASRMIVHRLLTLIRTGTAHGPLDVADLDGVADALADQVVFNGDLVIGPIFILQQPDGEFIRIEYRADSNELWLVTDPFGAAAEQPMLSGVTGCVFTLNRRTNEAGNLVLDRGTMDLTAVPAADTTMDLEQGPSQPVRMIASTMPRKLE